MQKLIQKLIEKKDIITTIVGVIAGIYQIAIFLKDFINSPDPNFTMLISGLFAIIIGWFTGKNVGKK